MPNITKTHSKQIVQIVYTTGLITYLLSLIGYFKFLTINIYYFIIFIIPVVIISLYCITNYLINILGYNTHQLKKTEKINTLDIDIYLPVCGEDLRVLYNTFTAVKTLKDNSSHNIRVYVGDDKKDPKVENIATLLGFNYFNRENGDYKKVGNLYNLFQNSKGKYFIVFDADFAPLSSFLSETIPVIENNDNIAILQTPQSFQDTKNTFEQEASNTQYDFYQVIQQSRDSFDGAICVGSNAVFRRDAFEKTKVFDWLMKNNIDHGEDVNTGFYLITKGYKVKYLNKHLAFGRSAQNTEQFVNQRNRWCSSSTRMFLSNIILKSNLTFMQKLCYYCGFLYYISDLMKILLNYMIFFVLIFHSNNLRFENTLFFIPHIVFGFVILPIFRGLPRSQYFSYINFLLRYINAYTLLLRLKGVGAKWIPTGSKSSQKSIINNLYKFISFEMIFYFTCIFITFLLMRVENLNFSFYFLIYWIIYNICNYVLFIYYTQIYKV